MTHAKPLCELSDEEVVLLCRGGDKQALEHIIIRYRNFVYSRAKKLFLIGSDRDDLVQEGMIGLYKAVKGYKPGKVPFRAFADICVNRQMISAVKRATRNKHKPLNSYVSLDNGAYDSDNDAAIFDASSAAVPQNPESIVIDREDLSGIEKKISSSLSRLELRVLVLYLEGYSYRRIGERIGKDAKSVDNAIRRIKRKLERII